MGYFFADSPVGLLSWIYEMLISGTDNYKWDDDEGKYAHLCMPSRIIGLYS